MKEEKVDILIIGGGLTGLTLAYLLRGEGLNIRIVEARDRWGGRIYTKRTESGPPQEMGATWLGKKHSALNNLLKELDLTIFEQNLSNKAIYEAISTSAPQLVQLPPNNDPSFRIADGTEAIIEALKAYLLEDQLHKGERVLSIAEKGDQLMVKTDRTIIDASIVVSTLPPYLFAKTINIKTDLPKETQSIMAATHTWMGESIKVSLTYLTPFWRIAYLSGTIFSNVGPISEMYDHSNYEDDSYALKGFFNGAYFSISKEERLNLVLNQLRKYYGDLADKYINYEEQVWRNEPLTFAPYDSHLLPHQNNGHAVFRKNYFNGKLYIGGAETADHHPGYMEGAVRSANFIAQSIMGSKS
ncbi:MAG: monoamine oxidase [Saprospiraceae bacterium]|jgi:monoamine oxidase